MKKNKAIVVGAGIVGLAAARALALKGFEVTVFERTQKAVGASIRNFGMVWPIGQPAGDLYQRAIRSRNIWKEIGDTGAYWYKQTGSLHLAYHEDEWRVLHELQDKFGSLRRTELLSPQQVIEKSAAVQPEGLLGGLWSGDEIIVDPREAISTLPAYLEEKWGVRFFWTKSVVKISGNSIFTGDGREYNADVIFVCSGADLEILYPEYYLSSLVTKCKLQMMRLEAQANNWSIGPALCGGLSLIHYKSFEVAPSLGILKLRYQSEMAEYLKLGIHVMVSQNGKGELTIGDSHEYGLTHDPFDRAFINGMILDYLRKFARFKSWKLIESWHGIYAKSSAGETALFISPTPGVYIVNALGGAGMTLSFGLLEELTAAI